MVYIVLSMFIDSAATARICPDFSALKLDIHKILSFSKVMKSLPLKVISIISNVVIVLPTN